MRFLAWFHEKGIPEETQWFGSSSWDLVPPAVSAHGSSDRNHATTSAFAPRTRIVLTQKAVISPKVRFKGWWTPSF